MGKQFRLWITTLTLFQVQGSEQSYSEKYHCFSFSSNLYLCHCSCSFRSFIFDLSRKTTPVQAYPGKAILISYYSNTSLSIFHFSIMEHSSKVDGFVWRSHFFHITSNLQWHNLYLLESCIANRCRIWACSRWRNTPLASRWWLFSFAGTDAPWGSEDVI